MDENRPNQALALLCDSYQDILEQAFYSAIDRYYERHNDELLVISPATKAGYISDYIYHNLKGGLEGKDGVTFIEKRQMRFILFDGQLLIRVKKLNSELQPSLNRTKSAQAFHHQQMLGDFPLALHVYLGYVLDKISGEMNTVAFACPDTSGNMAWRVDLQEKRVQRRLDFNSIVAAQLKKRIRIKRKTG
jgi:hypothetical protein